MGQTMEQSDYFQKGLRTYLKQTKKQMEDQGLVDYAHTQITEESQKQMDFQNWQKRFNIVETEEDTDSNLKLSTENSIAFESERFDSNLDYIGKSLHNSGHSSDKISSKTFKTGETFSDYHREQTRKRYYQDIDKGQGMRFWFSNEEEKNKLL